MRTVIKMGRVLQNVEDWKNQHRTDESGSLTVFTLFLFVLILFIAGMAVDLMHYEKERAGLQNAIDTCVVSASSIDQQIDPEELVLDCVDKAGFNPDLVDVTPVTVRPDGTTITSRSVTASADFRVPTMFMRMMGIDALDGLAAGTAVQGSEVLEIALVLDISGSMALNSKMENLKSAAKAFVTTVLNNSDPSRVSISIIPYNQQVYMSQDLMTRLNLTNSTTTLTGTTGLAGEVTSYDSLNAATRCASFSEQDFRSRSLAEAGTTIDTTASFVDDLYYWGLDGVTNVEFEQPEEFSYWCGDFHPKVLLYQNNETDLHTFIDGLRGIGATAIDYGMNWGVGVLDPSFAPVVAGMVDDNLLDEQMRGRPTNYSASAGVKKYIVLMTDGQNTGHLDLDPAYKQGPSRIWYSDTLAGGVKQNGYLVEMPDNAATERWYVPGDPATTADDYYLPEGATIITDAEQWTFHKLYREFRTNDVANYFFSNSDTAAFTEYSDVVRDVGGFSVADDNLEYVCDAAKEEDRIEVYTVAFEAPAAGQTVLRNCASGAANYFDVDGTEISEAFASIAVQISLLRLTD